MRKLLQQALDALENSYPTPTYQESTSSMFERRRKAIAALKAELAKPGPEPEPVSKREDRWMHECLDLREELKQLRSQK